MNNFDPYKAAFKIALSLVLFYWLAFYMNWDLPKYGAVAITVISMDSAGASIQKGIMRLLGTVGGLIIGVIFVIFFLEDRWTTMVVLSLFLFVCMYFMQGSKYQYAWHIAAFMPFVIWSGSYMNQQYAFEYAIYRTLETSAGIIIYTVIDTLLWPKSAAAKLMQQSSGLSNNIYVFFKQLRELIAKGSLQESEKDIQPTISGEISGVFTTLQQALTDTSNVKYNKEIWEEILLNMRSQYSALAMLTQNKDDYDRLGKKGKIWLNQSSDVLDEIFSRISGTWEALTTGNDSEHSNKTEIQAIPDLSEEVLAGLSRFDRLVLYDFKNQINILDKSSRKALQAVMVLAGEESKSEFKPNLKLKEIYKLSFWQPAKVMLASIPSIGFILAYLFWIYTNPDLGPSLPELYVVFGIIIVASKLDSHTLLKVLKIVLIIMFVVITPIYFFLMPVLVHGYEILALVFIYTFVAAYFGQKVNLIKVLLINLLVAMVGITNFQTYSFFTIAESALGMIIVFGGLALLMYVLKPGRPEQNMLSKMNVFYRDCAHVLSMFNLSTSTDLAAQYKKRKRYFESSVSPVPGEMKSLEKSLDYKIYPDNSADKVGSLVNGCQNISYKMQDLELASRQYAIHADSYKEVFGAPVKQLQGLLVQVFSNWSKYQSSAKSVDEEASLKGILKVVETQLDNWDDSYTDTEDNQVNADLYTMLGSIRGLVNAMTYTENTMQQINFEKWREQRF